jgi:pectin lyase
MISLRKFILFTSFAVIAFVCQAEAARPADYPVQEFRFGIGNTNRNIKVVNTNAGSALNSVNVWTANSGKNERWYLNFISSGVYEIINAANDLAMTNENGTLVMRANTGAANQRFKMEAVEKDSEGYWLYYKVVSNTDANSALTYAPNGDIFSMKTYSGLNGTAEYQKFKLNLDGLEGYAANALLSGKEKAGTIGGLLGETVTVNNLNDFIAAMDSKAPLTIVVKANIDMKNQGADKQRVRDNKTIVGSYNANTLYDSQIRTNDRNGKAGDKPSDNIVIRNIRFAARTLSGTSGVILLQIWSSRQIWVDHCTFDAEFPQDVDEVGKHIWINTPYANYMDSLDRYRSPDYITISYVHFKNRFWTVAYGTQNDEISRDRTTLMYNKWEKCARRTPQIGNGSGHIYSSYHTYEGKAEISEQIIGGDGSNILSENMRFEGYKGKEIITGPIYRDVGSYTADNSSSSLSALKVTAKGTAITPKDYYGYTLINVNQNANDVKTFCNRYSGVFNAYDKIKYITDSDMANFAGATYKIPFLKDISVVDNKPPTAKLTVSRGVFMPGDTVMLTAEAADEDGAISKVEFMNGNLKLGEKNSVPYEFVWIPGESGTYSLAVRVSDNKKLQTVSERVNVTVGENIGSGTLIEDLHLFDPAGKANWSIQNSLAVGDSVHGDRVNTWVSLPESVIGAEYIRTAIDPKEATTKEQARFKTKAAVTVFVLLDSRVIEPTNGDPLRELPAWLEGWTRSGEAKASNNDDKWRYYVYEKNFVKGETVTLGTNVTTQTVINYAVAVKESKPSSITRPPYFMPKQVTPHYYSLKGEPLGTVKPTNAGVYLMKQGSSIKKIMVR